MSNSHVDREARLAHERPGAGTAGGLGLDPDAPEIDVESLFAPGPGRPPTHFAEVVAEVVPLTETDLEHLFADGPDHSVRPLQTVRAFHHTLAIMLAQGRREIDIARLLQITSGTISNLKKSEPFQELVSAYMGQAAEKAFEIIPLMATVGQEALSALHEKLVGPERDGLEVRELTSIFTEMADRTGHSPVRRAEVRQSDASGLTPEDIAEIKRSLGREDPVLAAVDITPQKAPVEAPAGGGPREGQLRIVGPVQGEETPGPQGSGDGLSAQGDAEPDPTIGADPVRNSQARTVDLVSGREWPRLGPARSRLGDAESDPNLGAEAEPCS